MKVLLTRQERIDRINSTYPLLADVQLLRARERFVPGAGSLNPSILFIGDVPGHHESLSGQALDGHRKAMVQNLLRGIDLKLEHVHTTHIVKYRTIGGRDPKPDEMTSSMPTLLNEIDVLKPHVIVTWGRYALDTFAKGQKLQDVHGKHIVSDHGFMFVPMFSPDAGYVNANVTRILVEDFQTIRSLV